MSLPIPLSRILNYASQAIAEALNRYGMGEEDCVAIAIGLRTGYLSPFLQSSESIQAAFTDPLLSEVLRPALTRAERIFAALLLDQPAGAEQFVELAEVLASLGSGAKELGAADMAYSLYELSYASGVAVSKPALEVATALCDLADPYNEDQLYSSRWRYATERLRDSIARRQDWLAAIDAVETALSAQVARPEHQAELYRQLEAVLVQTQDTPIAGLAMVVAVQSPPHAIPRHRREAVARLVLRFLGAPRDLHEEGTDEWLHYAGLRAQNLLDDVRLKLMGDIPLVRPSITWHDLTLEHRGLISAVPLGEALVVDPVRTGTMLLELAHEITHAYCLLGPIGAAQRACRAGIQYLEMLLADAHEPSRWPNALQRLPDTDAAHTLAYFQLEAAIRGQLLLSTWTPWLEGVALYLELLCDPKEDPTEIMLPFTAVRSLVDYPPIEREPEETEAEWAQRHKDGAAAAFEDFYSQVYSFSADLRHGAYFRKGGHWAIYLPGYLLVRSVVARWEQTLGFRLPPIRAVKLLLAATRNGSMQAIPRMDSPLETFAKACYDGMESWLSSIAQLDRSAISRFLQPVGARERSIRYSWITGRPEPISPGSTTELETLQTQFNALRDSVANLIFDSQESPAESEPLAHHYAAYRDVVEVHDKLVYLLPVGRDEARLIIATDGSLTVCPRTYAGVVKAGEGTRKDVEYPRYSMGSFLPKHQDEPEALRRLLAMHRTGRVLMTRVIDLAGNERAPAGSSYVYMGLGEQWKRVLDGFVGTDLAEEDAVLEATMAARVNVGALTGDESTTLASLGFLARRFRACWPDSAMAELAAFDRDGHAANVGIHACAKAFGIPLEEAGNILRDVPAKDLHTMAHYLYATGCGRHPGGDAADTSLGSAVVDDTSYSGIVPFGGKR